MRIAWATLAIVALALAPGAQGFASVKTGHSPHDKITAVASDLGWPDDAVEALQEGVRQADISDFKQEKVDGKQRIVAQPSFNPSHHCDRIPPNTDDQAFNATVGYVGMQRDLAANLSGLDPPAALRALGRALHALQDCYSHSNIVDLGPLEQGQLQAALLGKPDAGPPEGLVLCGSKPGLAEIGRPPGDPYPHDDFNKDAPKSSPESDLLLPDGRSKHEAALALAQDTTSAFLVAFMADRDANETTALMEVEPIKHDGKDPKDIPGPETVLVLASILILAELVRDRRDR